MDLLERFRWWWLLPAFASSVVGGFLAVRSDRSVPGVARQADDSRIGSDAVVEPDAKPTTQRLAQLEGIASLSGDELPDRCREVLALKHGGSHQLRALMDRWIELDPRAGFELFKSDSAAGQEGTIGHFALGEYCGRWALVDPDSAVREARLVDDHVAVDRVASALAAHRPADYFRLDHGGSSFWDRGAASSFGMKDPQGAVAAVSRKSFELLAHVAGGWASHDPQGALAWVEQVEATAVRLSARQAVANRLLESEPELAARLFKKSDEEQAALVAKQLPTPDNDYSWHRAVKVLGESDPAGALGWASKYYPEAALGLVPELLPSNAVAAVDMLAKLPDSVLREGRLSVSPGPDWRPSELDAAIANVSNIANPATRESVHSWLLGAQARSDPEAAIASAIESLSDPTARSHVFNRGMDAWARQDLTAASEWLAGRSPGRDTDGAIVGLLESAQYVEPESALTWAASITDPTMKIDSLSTVFGVWRGTDEFAAQEALANLGLSEDEQRKLHTRGIRF